MHIPSPCTQTWVVKQWSERESLGSPWLQVHTMLDRRPLVTTTKDKKHNDKSKTSNNPGQPVQTVKDKYNSLKPGSNSLCKHTQTKLNNFCGWFSCKIMCYLCFWLKRFKYFDWIYCCVIRLEANFTIIFFLNTSIIWLNYGQLWLNKIFKYINLRVNKLNLPESFLSGRPT